MVFLIHRWRGSGTSAIASRSRLQSPVELAFEIACCSHDLRCAPCGKSCPNADRLRRNGEACPANLEREKPRFRGAASLPLDGRARLISPASNADASPIIEDALPFGQEDVEGCRFGPPRCICASADEERALNDDGSLRFHWTRPGIAGDPTGIASISCSGTGRRRCTARRWQGSRHSW